jgi:hypothetical protein
MTTKNLEKHNLQRSNTIFRSKLKKKINYFSWSCIYSSMDRVLGFGPNDVGSNPAKCMISLQR